VVTQFNILFWISEVSPEVRREMADNSAMANGDEDADNEHMVGDDHTAMKRRMEIMEEQNALLRMRNAELEQKQRLAESAWAGNYKCDGCQRPGTELEGPRFHCMVCADNDFCITCYDGAEYHKTCRNHAMVILRTQQTIGAPAAATRGYPFNWNPREQTHAGPKTQQPVSKLLPVGAIGDFARPRGVFTTDGVFGKMQPVYGGAGIGLNVGDAALTPDHNGGGVGANVGPIGLTGVGLVQPPRPQPLNDLEAQKRDLLAMSTCPVCNNQFYRAKSVIAEKYTRVTQRRYKDKPSGALMSPTYGGFQRATVCSQACKDTFQQDDKRSGAFLC